MKLIEKTEISGTEVMFYEGIDFEYAKRMKDGDSFVIFFVDSYVASAKEWLRQKRLSCILDGSEDIGSINGMLEHRIPEIEGSNISIYQTSGQTMQVYEAVRKKLLSPESMSWSPPWGSA